MNPPSANPYRAAGTFIGATYTERQADRDLRRALERNQRYPYVLAPRQSGKSSLVAHVRAALGPEYRSAFVDFSVYGPAELADQDRFEARFFEDCRRSLGLEEGPAALGQVSRCRNQSAGAMPGAAPGPLPG